MQMRVSTITDSNAICFKTVCGWIWIYMKIFTLTENSFQLYYLVRIGALTTQLYL